MSKEKNIPEQKTAPRFEFRVTVDEPGRRVTLWDGADGYTFILRDKKPFVTSRPGDRDMSNEKWRALMAQAAAILQRLNDETPA